MDGIVLRRADFNLGIACLLIVITGWTFSSFLTSDILTGVEPYEKPWLLTWLCTCSFSLYLVRPFYDLLRNRLKSKLQSNEDKVAEEGYTQAPINEVHDDISEHRRPLPILIDNEEPLTVPETARLAAWFCLAWFAANWAMNGSLALTTVSSVTILSSTSGFFTLGLGRLAGVESFNFTKLSAVICSIAGVVLVSKSDNEVTRYSPNSPTIPPKQHRLSGDIVALISAMLYACYVILLKKSVGRESRLSMPLFFGFVGAFNILCLWPIGVLLHFIGVETLEWPHGGRLWASLGISALITCVSDYLYMVAMLKTSPLIVTLGMSLTIPLAVLGDLAEGTRLGGVEMIIGAALVLGAFILVGVAGHDESVQDVINERSEEVTDDTLDPLVSHRPGFSARV